MSVKDPFPGSLVQRSLEGPIDGEAFSHTLREILCCLCFQGARSILLDCSKANLCFCSTGDLLDIARKIAPFRPTRIVRIAHIVNASDPEQLRTWRMLETVLEMEGFRYRFFFDPQEAQAWLEE